MHSFKAFASLRSLSSPLPRTKIVHNGTRRAISKESTRNMSTKAPDQDIRILLTGSEGQIGTELRELLGAKYGHENVIASDIKKPTKASRSKVGILKLIEGPFEYIDVLDINALSKAVVEHNVDWIIHNSSLLSAVGEQNPQLAMEVNVKGLQNVLEVSRKYSLRVMVPSSIAAFGPTTPRDATPDLTIQRPTTIYGVTKVYAELLGEYYNTKYSVDFRSLRYPGIISSKTLPGGGTTDWAVDIFYQALLKGSYECFVRADTALPMMYMPDCLKGTQMMLEAPQELLKQRVYNLQGISFTPEILAKEIKKYIPSFTITYKPDFRQKIADSWPNSLDDSRARADWEWKHDYDIEEITKDMLIKLRAKLSDSKQPLQVLHDI